MQVDLIVSGANQLITCGSSGPKRGAAMADVGLLTDGALAVQGTQIVAVGPREDICARYDARCTVDASGGIVCPGFVDCHTHVVYAGDRLDEFEMRLRGAEYMDILQAGGGILSTVRATREAGVDQLVAGARRRLNQMLTLGTTTVEVKTGYGLDTASELKMLEAVARLAGADDQPAHPIDLVPTFLGAHAVPPEFRDRPQAYVELIVGEMLPAVAAWYAHSPLSRPTTAADQPERLPVPFFCDVFCEAGIFDRDQAAQVLRAGLMHGLPAKIHADEFRTLGGARLAAELGAVSADHLDVTPQPEIAELAASDTIAVLLPAVSFNLASNHFADARAMISAGVALALATDVNPGSAPCLSLPLVMAIACRYQHLLPAEALNACTINAAHAIGLGDKVGSLEVGKQADLLILDTPDYRDLTYYLGTNPVQQVIKRGQVL